MVVFPQKNKSLCNQNEIKMEVSINEKITHESNIFSLKKHGKQVVLKVKYEISCS